MSKQILILSDIHGNLNALESVLNDAAEYKIKKCVLLGDLIDYGMRSNEVIAVISKLNYEIICNIRGNHEDAIINDEYQRFSSDRGRESAKNTKHNLNAFSWNYIKTVMNDCGKHEFLLGDKKCLAVHGSLKDGYWQSISPGDDLSAYRAYDFVFSGHSHLPHYFAFYHKVDNPATRNKKKTIFINPGSVGQPRNINNRAQYAIFNPDTEEIFMKKVAYDIEGEQSKFDGQPVDMFYRDRLKGGI